MKIHNYAQLTLRNISQGSNPQILRYLQRFSGILCCVFLCVSLLISCLEKPAEDITYQHGQVILLYDAHHADNPNAYLDLDTGSINDGRSADLTLILSGGTSLVNVIQSLNGAKAESMGMQTSSIDDCRAQVDNFSTSNIPEVISGNHICVLTNQGRLALVEIDKVMNPQQGMTSVQVNFVIEIAPLSR